MATKKFEIKIPQKAIDLKVEHENVLRLFQDDFDSSLNGKLKLIQLMSGVRLSDLRLMSVNDVNYVFNTCISVLSNFRVNEKPQQTIVLGGKEFELIDPHKVSTAWHIDFNQSIKVNKADKDPVWMACMFYFPKGEIYGEVDGNENLIHPIRDRYELFKNEMPLQAYIEAKAFFLTKLQKSINRYMAKERAKKATLKVVNKINRLRGKEQLTL